MNEIGIIQAARADDQIVLTAVFLYPITTPKLDKDGANVIATPSAALPADFLAVLTADDPAKVAALDAGTMLFVTETVRIDAAEKGSITPAQVLARLRNTYTTKAAQALADYDEAYRFASYVNTLYASA